MSLFFSTGMLLDQPQVSPDAYAAAVAGIGGLVAYWRLGETTAGTLLDSSGNGHHGSYGGSPTFAAPGLTAPWQASDGRALDFAGMGHGTVAHGVTLAPARGTLGFYARPSATALAGAHFWVSKDADGTGANQLTVYALSDGTLRARFQDGGALTVQLDSHPGVIEAGVEYHVVVMWDELAVWLVLDGRVLTWSMAHQGGLTGNTDPWQFGRTFWNSTDSDVTIDEVALFDRRLTWPEIDLLSEYVRGIGYDPGAMSDTLVSTVGGIEAALAAAGPGERILVADGTYDGVGPLTLSNSGAKWSPIVLAPQNPGGVTFTNAFITLRNRWFVIDGINLNGSQSRPRASDCRYWRVTRSTTTDLSGPNGGTTTNDGFMSSIYGCFGRSDHHALQHAPTSEIGIIHHIRVEQSGDLAGNDALLGSYNLFDHCAVGPIDGSANNTREFLAIGANPIDGRQWMGTTCYRNRGVQQLSDREYVSVKSSGNLFIGNTWYGPVNPSPGENYHRHGGYSWCESEWYEIRTRILGARSVYIGCHATEDVRFWTGDIAFENWNAGEVLDQSSANYPQCWENVVVGCTLGGSAVIYVGAFVGTAREEIVTGTILYDCPAATIDGTWSTGTVESPTAPVPYTAAIELSPADVGPGAADPLVPPGWK